MDSIYKEEILDHYKHPRNFGQLDHPDIHVEANNPLCGDKLSMDLIVKDGVVEDVRFSGHSIEARLCAEDPAQGFLPQAGTVALWNAPGVRLGAGKKWANGLTPRP